MKEEEVEVNDDDGIWICGLPSTDDAGTSSGNIATLMLDSGSQATACAPWFAPEYGVDDTTKAPNVGHQKVVDLKFVSDEGGVDAQVAVDIADVKKNMAGMGRLRRAGFDMHFPNYGHTCWME